jgi:hypothetical protein
MDKILKAIVAAGIANLILNNLVLAICVGCGVYYYEDRKMEKSK